MNKVDEDFLAKLQSMWDSDADEFFRRDAVSDESILQLIRTNPQPSHIRRRVIRRWALFVSLMGLLVSVLVGTFLWSQLAIGWLVLLGLVGLLSLWSSIEVIYDLYLMHKGNMWAPTEVLERCVAQLNANEKRRMRWLRFFVVQQPSHLNDRWNYKVRWGRLATITMSLVLVAGVSALLYPRTESMPMVAKAVVDAEPLVTSAEVVDDDLCIMANQVQPSNQLAQLDVVSMQEAAQEVAQEAVPPAVEDSNVENKVMPAVNPSATEVVTEEVEAIKSYDKVVESNYHTIVRVRCNVDCVVAMVSDECSELTYNI